MNITEKELAEILRQHPETAHDVILETDAINQRIANVQEYVVTLKEAYEYEMVILRNEIANLQTECKHWSTTFHGDQSVCDRCGKEL